MEIKNIFTDLKNAEKDEAVGIRSIRLSGDDNFALYAAEIDGNKSIGAHYHTNGNEIYQVVEGNGQMNIGILNDEDNIEWKEPVVVKKGDCFTVRENEVHQLENTSSEKLIIIFACPYSHISTDRTVVKGIRE